MKDKETVLELGRGVSIADAADRAVNLAKQKKSEIVFIYNGILIRVSPNTTQNYVINAFFSQAMSQPNIGITSQQQKIYNN